MYKILYQSWGEINIDALSPNFYHTNRPELLYKDTGSNRHVNVSRLHKIEGPQVIEDLLPYFWAPLRSSTTSPGSAQLSGPKSVPNSFKFQPFSKVCIFLILPPLYSKRNLWGSSHCLPWIWWTEANFEHFLNSPRSKYWSRVITCWALMTTSSWPREVFMKQMFKRNGGKSIYDT